MLNNLHKVYPLNLTSNNFSPWQWLRLKQQRVQNPVLLSLSQNENHFPCGSIRRYCRISNSAGCKLNLYNCYSGVKQVGQLRLGSLSLLQRTCHNFCHINCKSSISLKSSSSCSTRSSSSSGGSSSSNNNQPNSPSRVLKPIQVSNSSSSKVSPASKLRNLNNNGGGNSRYIFTIFSFTCVALYACCNGGN